MHASVEHHGKHLKTFFLWTYCYEAACHLHTNLYWLIGQELEINGPDFGVLCNLQPGLYYLEVSQSNSLDDFNSALLLETF